MESLDEEDQAIGCKWFYKVDEGASSAGRVQFEVPNHNVIYYKEQFYAVETAGALLAVEIDPQPKINRITPCLKKHAATCKRY
ncbi:hypothetical protein MRB53_012708 [Persea americana]|uniref:Uncharacterized protein n=1 Tax=Persea americana TaxID=3435 RepID=A0ACC2LY33_PERAE|nr:hypothetical protein MRB53_012708 [Persea americana]